MNKRKDTRLFAGIALLACSFTLGAVLFSRLFKRKNRGTILLLAAAAEAAAGAYLLYYDYIEHFAEAARARMKRSGEPGIEFFGDDDEAHEAEIIMSAVLGRDDDCPPSGDCESSGAFSAVNSEAAKKSSGAGMFIPRDEDASEEDFK